MIESQSLFREDLHIIASEPLPVSKINWTKKSQAVFFGCPCMECSLPLRPTCGHVESNVKLTWNIWDVFFFRKNIKYGHFLIWGVFSHTWFGMSNAPQFQSLIRKNPSAQSFCCRWRNFMALYVKDARGKSVLDYVRSEGTGPLQKHGGFSVI